VLHSLKMIIEVLRRKHGIKTSHNHGSSTCLLAILWTHLPFKYGL
jgi:hypothetical protein